eukprot:SAG22_NODE_493_length_9820_cov_53.085588_6_plen_167_part_00
MRVRHRNRGVFARVVSEWRLWAASAQARRTIQEVEGSAAAAARAAAAAELMTAVRAERGQTAEQAALAELYRKEAAAAASELEVSMTLCSVVLPLDLSLRQCLSLPSVRLPACLSVLHASTPRAAPGARPGDRGGGGGEVAGGPRRCGAGESHSTVFLPCVHCLSI